MFNKLLNRLQAAPPAEPEQAPDFDLEKLRMLARYFPIGQKLHYFPEYHHDAVLGTIILAYRVNDKFVYANDGVLLGEEFASRGFRMAGGERVAVEDLKSFQLLVPDTSEMVRQLDYFTRAELGRAGQFRQGNVITLANETAGRGVPTLETHVYRRLEMKDGPYASSSTVLLIPDFASLTISDKRRHQRVQTTKAACIYYGRDGQAMFPCVLRDFSENSLRLGVDQADQAMPALRQGQAVLVEFNVAETDASYRFKGRLMRQDEETCVIRIDQIHHNGEFRKPSLMDVLEIKTQLLNTPG